VTARSDGPATAPQALILDVFGKVVDRRAGVEADVAAAGAVSGAMVDAPALADAAAPRDRAQ
jgi:hypothetical protein